MVVGIFMMLSHSDTMVDRNQLAKLTQVVGRSCQVIDKQQCTDNHIFKGNFNLIKLRDGLTLHTSDGCDAHNLKTQAELKPRIGFMLFLNGQCDVCYGERKVTLGVKHKQQKTIVPEAVLISVDRKEIFTREAQEGRYLRKVVVGIDPNWLENGGFEGLEGYKKVIQFSQQHLKVERHLVSKHMQSIAEKILNPPDYSPFLKNLYVEGLTLEIVSEALTMLTDQQSLVTNAAKIHPYEKRRINKVLELLENTIELKDLSLDFIAQQVGTNTNTLQRNFRNMMGMTVFEYLRCRKLTEAKNALENNMVNVLEAALLAGYSSAANFSTAFKKQFGVTPNQVRTKIYAM